MNWGEQVFQYCERGASPGFWAEPFNALSNGAFLAVALAAAMQLRRLSPLGPGGEAERRALALLAALVAVIGAGSFVFHTFATRWALIADVGPITVFMVAYLAYALRAFLGLGWPAIGLLLPAFLVAGRFAAGISCAGPRLVAVTEAAREPCFNGSLGYAPALVALLIVGFLRARRQADGRRLLAAGAVFLASLVLRTLDRDICAATRLLGQLRGTHALWHLLNAVTLYLLLGAGIGRLREISRR